MFNKLSSIVHGNKKIYYYERMMRHRNDIDFVNRVIDINRDERSIRLLHVVNSDTVLYYIEVNQYGMGMGAFLRWAIHGLWEADKYNWIPVIKFSGVYDEKKVINGTTNMFEYYYKQPGKYDISSLKNETCFLFDEGTLKRHANCYGMSKDLLVGYDINDKYIVDMGRLAAKYLHLNDSTQKYICDSINSIIDQNDKVIGVHIRGTDYKLKWKNHPKMISPKQYYDYIDTLINNGYNKIFLATDDEEYVELFMQKYARNIVLYGDVNRGRDKVNVAMAENRRANNNYLNGLEVIRDIYTLAACDALVSGLSQVSVASRIINQAIGKEYSECIIINNGVN
ncbi:hypothetical protein [Selenomonas ruminantium]|uniref:hypothetical protein n=1 Tax=Selenomonas ruminantium TaxID=971 RepID=UPI0026ECE9F3|nr:hypothetical protein [Selenomonas ruminantium]